MTPLLGGWRPAAPADANLRSPHAFRFQSINMDSPAKRQYVEGDNWEKILAIVTSRSLWLTTEKKALFVPVHDFEGDRWEIYHPGVQC